MYRYEQVAERFFQVGIKSGPEWMCSCLKHEDASASLQFNVDKGLFICFSCHWSGNVQTLMNYLGERFYEEVDVSDVLAKLDALEEQAKKEDIKMLPESSLRRYDFKTDYWHGRGFTKTTEEAFDLGFDPLDQVATIPVRDIRGRLYGVIRRRLVNDDGPRYMYPKGFPRKRNLFGSWLVANSDSYHVVLCEGSVDAMAIWQAGYQGLAQYGSSLSNDQAALIRRLGATRVTLFFDNDKAGMHATDVAIAALRDVDLRVVSYGRRGPKDPGAMADDPDRLQTLIDGAVRIV